MVEIKLTFGELVTLAAVLIQGLVVFIKFDRRITLVEERVRVLMAGCPILRRLKTADAEEI